MFFELHSVDSPAFSLPDGGPGKDPVQAKGTISRWRWTPSLRWLVMQVVALDASGISVEGRPAVYLAASMKQAIIRVGSRAVSLRLLCYRLLPELS